MIRKFGIAALAIAALIVSQTVNATAFRYLALMDGPSESPPNASPGTGASQVDYDDVTHMMRVQASFSGLVGTTSAAHIHAPTPAPFTLTAGVATQTPSFAGFPLGVTSGSMDTTFNLALSSSWNPSYISGNGGTPAGAEAAFFAAMNSGRAYFNIHTSFRSAGEIRGFMLPVPVPEPATMALAAVGFAAVIVGRRSRKHA